MLRHIATPVLRSAQLTRRLTTLTTKEDVLTLFTKHPGLILGLHGTDFSSAINISENGVHPDTPLYISFDPNLVAKYSSIKTDSARLVVLFDPTNMRKNELYGTYYTTNIAHCALILPGTPADTQLQLFFNDITSTGNVVVGKWCLVLMCPLILAAVVEHAMI